MRKVSLFIIVLVMVGFFGCEKPEVPGRIPGMGDSVKELEAEEYKIKEDLNIIELKGVSKSSINLKSTSVDITTEVSRGSGDQVIIKVTIENNSTEDYISEWFRAGSVFDVNLDGYQKAILLAPVNFCVPAKTTITFNLYLYCLNKGHKNSDETVTYELLGVTTSESMLELVDSLKYKMINYEYYTTFGQAGIDAYNKIYTRIQEIVWKITNGDGMDESDYDFIANLQDLPTTFYPGGIYDINTVLPDWCLDPTDVVENSGALSFVKFDVGCDIIAPVNGTYTISGFPFKAETKDGWVKFEENTEEVGGSQLGEGGEQEDGTFVFTASCNTESITVTVKNKDLITKTINIANEESLVMSNGFLVRFVSIEETSDGFKYTFKVSSDSFDGGQTN